MFIIIYRPHHELNCNTQFIGPFVDHDAAYAALCAMPALGPYDPPQDRVVNLSGVKYVAQLSSLEA